MQLSRYVDCCMCRKCRIAACVKRGTVLLSITITNTAVQIEIDKKVHLKKKKKKKLFAREKLMEKLMGKENDAYNYLPYRKFENFFKHLHRIHIMLTLFVYSQDCTEKKRFY